MKQTSIVEPGARPRIAMVSTHGYVAANPPLGAADTGGQVVFVLELSKKLAELGHDVDIWTRQFGDQPAVERVNDRVRVLRAPCGGKEFITKEYLHESLPEWCENALRIIHRDGLKYHFINSHYWDGGVAAQHLSDVLDVPHIHTPHSLGIWKLRQMETDRPNDRESFMKEYNFDKRIHHERMLYADAQCVVATTPPQADMLRDDYELPVEKIRMIPPGYDDNRFYPVSEASRKLIRQRLGLSGHLVFAVGRLAKNKGYDLLVQGFSVMASRNPNARLLLAVGGESMDAQEKAILLELKTLSAKLGLQDKVEFRGFIADADMADYYRGADIFALSSRYEPFGMTAIEAMACGTPTVVTIHGGLYRALTYGRHALIADPLDSEDFGITMHKLSQLPRMRSRLGRMGAHKARSLFTWTGVAQQLIAEVERRATAVFEAAHDEWAEPWHDAD